MRVRGQVDVWNRAGRARWPARRAVTRNPDDAADALHDCQACGALLRPMTDDCCVFCSDGAVALAADQQERNGCVR